ncbi:NAD(P)-dependent glycerol-1-phosphate dehydrogenase [Acidianus sulfidivorans JP7]|uniref:Glycerol-1-phosphate dehydrogenase [NAD(P)+] n=1 Tax=Acidianus sulfidivorans JP7 TaxID=619593 RepID=A0A2U9IMX4_9CREN|nr:NAD(P)-dependent glycerol-1-phosphate dehydrogenase [Acidianus sulfidivorans]AWR97360.1 NAD(P)-dependent glycerol-1-phosphate dehydrogenase [Acidianus sulfidivorans JP7]
MELQDHIIGLPERIYIGSGIISHIPEYFEQICLKDPYVIVTGKHVRKIIVDKITEEFKNYEIVEVEEANLDEVNKVEEIARKMKSSTIIGIGGGKSIDVAKFAAFNLNRKFISIPTAPSHDGITSPFAAIKGLGKPVSMKAKEPTAIIADIDILSSAPKRLINSGIGDTLGKIVAVRDWKLAAKLRGEYYGDYTASLALLSARHAMNATRILNKDIKYGVRVLVEALISSGVAMAMAGSTRPASGSEHLFAHAVEMLYPEGPLHGELVGVGTIIMAYIHGIRWREIKKALKRIGAPTNSKELGVPDEIIVKALTIAHTIRPERYTILGDRGLTRVSAEKVAKETGVIP